ncbi:hypothetical protein SteCoe_27821 [Stentor coeruleus]|uniref:dual-specificity kinase n=1 Tax=Stentor coeruleus TaxID=5963 RepID=A0A1R2B9M5_9CILI|nr:hypothetical protein SteCoe_27821 [Stentor coeruleus]
MNGPKASPRFKIIKFRPIGSKTGKKKTITINPIKSKLGTSALMRSSGQNDSNSSKQPTSSKRKIENCFPVLSDKFSLNSSINTSINTSTKLNGSLNRTQIFTSQGTPHSQIGLTDGIEFIKLKEDFKLSRPIRNSISRRKSTSRNTQDPDTLLATQQLPLKVPQIFKQFLGYMTKYEQMEILDYSEIYYLGMKSLKIKGDTNDTNYGYDDERNDYKLVTTDHIAYRYEIGQILGKGSFGQVVKCFDHKTKSFVALKIIRNQKRFHRQGKVEVKVLAQLKAQDPEDQFHTIKMFEYFVFRKHICITFELLSMNLYELLKTNNFQGFSLSLVRRFAVQIVTCLVYMKEYSIIHCDLKPENILLKDPNKSGIKVIDFGSSCFIDEKLYTYIQSRFYRAPEIILGIDYTCAIDMWSLGCILAEIYSGYPLFPGESEAEQLLCIMEVRGIPPKEVLDKSTRKKLFFDGNHPKIVANSRGKKRHPGTRTLLEKCKSNDEAFLDFLDKCFEWDPEKRMVPEEAFAHEFIIESLRGHNMKNKSSAVSKGDGS